MLKEDLNAYTNLQQIYFASSSYGYSSVFQTSFQMQKKFLYIKNTLN